MAGVVLVDQLGKGVIVHDANATRSADPTPGARTSDQRSTAANPHAVVHPVERGDQKHSSET